MGLIKLSAFLILLLLSACSLQEKVVFEHSFSSNSWAASDIITVKAEDIKNSPNLYLRVKHGADYGYENLYISILQDTSEQVVSIPLMDSQGYWKGTKRGNVYTVDFPFIPYANTFRVEQYSREANLNGLVSIEVIRK